MGWGLGSPPKGSMWGAALPQGLSKRAPRCVPQEVRMCTCRSEGARGGRVHVCHTDTHVHAYTGIGGCTPPAARVPWEGLAWPGGCHDHARAWCWRDPQCFCYPGRGRLWVLHLPQPQQIPPVKQPWGPHVSQTPVLHHPPQLEEAAVRHSHARDLHVPELPLGDRCRGWSPPLGDGHQGWSPPLGEGHQGWSPPLDEDFWWPSCLAAAVRSRTSSRLIVPGPPSTGPLMPSLLQVPVPPHPLDGHGQGADHRGPGSRALRPGGR